MTSYLDALYWGIAAFSTAGIADSPHLQTAKIIGGIWIIPGSAIFFGTIIATFFMRALQRPARKLIDAIEYNMEKLKEHQSNTTQL